MTWIGFNVYSTGNGSNCACPISTISGILMISSLYTANWDISYLNILFAVYHLTVKPHTGENQNWFVFSATTCCSWFVMINKRVTAAKELFFLIHRLLDCLPYISYIISHIIKLSGIVDFMYYDQATSHYLNQLLSAFLRIYASL